MFTVLKFFHDLFDDGRGIARNTVSYETGEWKYLKLSAFFINFSVN